MKTIVCSHGFGVKADARGMLTEIAAAFPDYDFKMFNYNEILPNGDVVVPSLDEQANKLQQVIQDQEGEVIVLAHSQGCVVAGLVELDKVSQVILLAPPVIASIERVIDRLMKRPNAVINLDGVSKLPRSDGLVTHLPKEYMQSLKNRDPLNLYQTIADTKPTTIVRATNDHVLGVTSFDTLLGVNVTNIDADHDFTGDARPKLIQLLGSLFN